MRPVTVRMSGLRSYRSEETIDFSDTGLMAIVGDTGAGKSSMAQPLPTCPFSDTRTPNSEFDAVSNFGEPRQARRAARAPLASTAVQASGRVAPRMRL